MTMHFLFFAFLCLRRVLSLPNIIILVADDLGWNDVAYHRATDCKTPKINSLASNGLKLEEFYTYASSTPTRAALFTGRYSHRYGFQDGNLNGLSPCGLDTNETLLSQALRNKGYNTHMIGKWHLGSAEYDFLPQNRGFDTFEGFYGTEIDHQFYTRTTGVRTGVDFRNGSVRWNASETGLQSYELLSGIAVDYIEDYASTQLEDNDDTPFFMVVSFALPHSPIARISDYASTLGGLNSFNTPDRFKYATNVYALDAAVDTIATALKLELNGTTLWDNSWVIFLSDSGPDKDYGNAHPLRGFKTAYFEGGIRVPAFVTGGLLPASREGDTEDTPLHIVDIFPTVAGMATFGTGAYDLDGDGAFGLLKTGNDPTLKFERPLILNVDNTSCTNEDTYVCGAIRYGDLKLIVGQSSAELTSYWTPLDNSAISVDNPTVSCADPPNVTDTYLSTDCHNLGEPCLYNISSDPCEYTDISDVDTNLTDALYILLEAAYYEQVQSISDKPECANDAASADPDQYCGFWSSWVDEDAYDCEGWTTTATPETSTVETSYVPEATNPNATSQTTSGTTETGTTSVETTPAETTPAETPTLPNIVFLIVDDLGWNDVSWHNATDCGTPNLDNLAANGLELDQFYVYPWCSPTRAAMLTGRYSHRYGLQNGPLDPLSGCGLDLDETLITDIFKVAGYDNYLVGKWHLGSASWEYTPLWRGYDEFEGFHGSSVDHFDYTRSVSKYTGVDYRNFTEPWNASETGLYSSQLQGNTAVHFIEQAVAKQNSSNMSHPFFLHVAFGMVHTPIEIISDYRNAVGGKDYFNTVKRFGYATNVRALDIAIRKIEMALKNTEVWKDTWVVITSDNGGDPVYGSNHPLRGFKNSYFEGGIRTPTIITGGKLPQNRRGKILDAPIHITDLFPTFCSFADADCSFLALDGVNIADAIEEGDTSALVNRTIILSVDFSDCNNTNNASDSYCGAVRWNDWKLVARQPGGKTSSYWKQLNNPNVTDNPSVVCDSPPNVTDTYLETECNWQNQPCLFNIADDPCEHNDVSATHPDIKEWLYSQLKEAYMQQTPLIEYREGCASDISEADPAKFCGFWPVWQEETEYECYGANYTIPTRPVWPEFSSTESGDEDEDEDEDEDNEGKGLSAGEISAIVIFAVLVPIAIGVFAYWWFNIRAVASGTPGNTLGKSAEMVNQPEFQAVQQVASVEIGASVETGATVDDFIAGASAEGPVTHEEP